MSKDINIDLKSIKAKVLSIPGFLKQYVTFIFIISVLGIYGFLVWQINTLSNIAPSEQKITEEQQVIKRPKIDEDVVKKIEQLEDQNVAVKSLFKAARDNPFKEN